MPFSKYLYQIFPIITSFSAFLLELNENSFFIYWIIILFLFFLDNIFFFFGKEDPEKTKDLELAVIKIIIKIAKFLLQRLPLTIINFFFKLLIGIYNLFIYFAMSFLKSLMQIYIEFNLNEINLYYILLCSYHSILNSILDFYYKVLAFRFFRDFFYTFISTKEITFTNYISYISIFIKNLKYKILGIRSLKDFFYTFIWSEFSFKNFLSRILAIKSFKDLLHFLTGETDFKGLLYKFLGLK